jgi:hypothetical protein
MVSIYDIFYFYMLEYVWVIRHYNKMNQQKKLRYCSFLDYYYSFITIQILSLTLCCYFVFSAHIYSKLRKSEICWIISNLAMVINSYIVLTQWKTKILTSFHLQILSLTYRCFITSTYIYYFSHAGFYWVCIHELFLFGTIKQR